MATKQPLKSGSEPSFTHLSIPEYETMRRCYKLILSHVKQSPSEFGDALFSEGYISPYVRDYVRQESTSDMKKAQKLVDTVIDRVEFAPETYHGFVKILEQEGSWVECLVKELRECFKLIQESTIIKKDDDSSSIDSFHSASDFGESLQNISTTNSTTIDKTEIAKSHVREVESAGGDLVGNICGFVCPFCKKCSIEEFFSKSGCPMAASQVDAKVTNETMFPFLNVSALSVQDREELEAKLISNTRDMIYLFADMKQSMILSLESCNLNIRQVIAYVLSHAMLMAGPGTERKHLEGEDEIELRKAESITDIFLALHPYTSFFNYEIIERVVMQFGSPDDQEKIRKYVTVFNNFCKRSVFEVPPNVFHYPTTKSNSRFFSVKFMPEIPATLGDVVKVRRKIADILDIKVGALQLHSIEKGCVLLRFLVPLFVVDERFPVSESQMMALKGINVRVVEDPGESDQQARSAVHLQGDGESNLSPSKDSLPPSQSLITDESSGKLAMHCLSTPKLLVSKPTKIKPSELGALSSNETQLLPPPVSHAQRNKMNPPNLPGSSSKEVLPPLVSETQTKKAHKSSKLPQLLQSLLHETKSTTPDALLQKDTKPSSTPQSPSKNIQNPPSPRSPLKMEHAPSSVQDVRAFISRHICHQLNPADICGLVFVHSLPSIYLSKPALEVLVKLEILGRFSVHKLDTLSRLMKVIHRNDLAKQVDNFVKSRKKKSSKKKLSDVPHLKTTYSHTESETSDVHMTKIQTRILMEHVQELLDQLKRASFEGVEEQSTKAMAIIEDHLLGKLVRVSSMLSEERREDCVPSATTVPPGTSSEAVHPSSASLHSVLPSSLVVKEFVFQEVCPLLTPVDIQSLVFLHDLPPSYSEKSALEVLIKLEMLGKYTLQQLDSLSLMLFDIRRYDLTKKADKFCKSKKRKSSKRKPSIHQIRASGVEETIKAVELQARIILEQIQKIKMDVNMDTFEESEVDKVLVEAIDVVKQFQIHLTHMLSTLEEANYSPDTGSCASSSKQSKPRLASSQDKERRSQSLPKYIHKTQSHKIPLLPPTNQSLPKNIHKTQSHKIPLLPPTKKVLPSLSTEKRSEILVPIVSDKRMNEDVSDQVSDIKLDPTFAETISEAMRSRTPNPEDTVIYQTPGPFHLRQKSDPCCASPTSNHIQSENGTVSNTEPATLVIRKENHTTCTPLASPAPGSDSKSTGGTSECTDFSGGSYYNDTSTGDSGFVDAQKYLRKVPQKHDSAHQKTYSSGHYTSLLHDQMNQSHHYTSLSDSRQKKSVSTVDGQKHSETPSSGHYTVLTQELMDAPQDYKSLTRVNSIKDLGFDSMINETMAMPNPEYEYAFQQGNKGSTGSLKSLKRTLKRVRSLPSVFSHNTVSLQVHTRFSFRSQVSLLKKLSHLDITQQKSSVENDCVKFSVKYVGSTSLFLPFTKESIVDALSTFYFTVTKDIVEMRISARGILLTDKNHKLFFTRNYPRAQLEGFCSHPTDLNYFSFATQHPGFPSKMKVHVFMRKKEPCDQIIDAFRCLLNIGPTYN